MASNSAFKVQGLPNSVSPPVHCLLRPQENASPTVGERPKSINHVGYRNRPYLEIQRSYSQLSNCSCTPVTTYAAVPKGLNPIVATSHA